MSSDIKAIAELASLRALRPFTRFALKAKIGVGEFVWLVKQAYVLEVAEEEKRKGRSQLKVTHLANTTGLTERDVRAVLAQLKGGAHEIKDSALIKAQRVLRGWWTDPKFQDPVRRKPLPLKYRGRHPSFQSLVEEHSGQRHLAAIRDELIAAQAARQLEGGTIEVLRKTCAPLDWDSRDLDALGKRIARCFDVYLHNLDHPFDPRFTQSIAGTLDAEQARVVIPVLTNNAIAFLGNARDTITHPKHAPKTAGPRSKALEFGIDIDFWQRPSDTSASSRDLKNARGRRRKPPSARAESK